VGALDVDVEDILITRGTRGHQASDRPALVLVSVVVHVLVLGARLAMD
jgi:hypothetical protein